MKWILVRHGEDTPGFRGGWSNESLTIKGKEQVEVVAKDLLKYNVDKIYSSDLPRAVETANIISDELKLKVELLPQLREMNNGVLAGMKHVEALELYPGLFYNTLEYDEKYPGGESPKGFYERIKEFSENFERTEENYIIVTHGGVIDVLYCLLHNIEHTNKRLSMKVGHAEYLVFDFQDIKS